MNDALIALAERVEKGSGEDAVLRTEISIALALGSDAHQLWLSSLDAVVALIEERLPEAFWIVETTGYARLWRTQDRFWAARDEDNDGQGARCSPARSLLAAFLRALAQEPDNAR